MTAHTHLLRATAAIAILLLSSVAVLAPRDRGTAPVIVTMMPLGMSQATSDEGIPVGEFVPRCDVRLADCATIPSGAVARGIGLDRGCGRVTIGGLAKCLGMPVVLDDTGQHLILVTRTET